MAKAVFKFVDEQIHILHTIVVSVSQPKRHLERDVKPAKLSHFAMLSHIFIVLLSLSQDQWKTQPSERP